MLHKTLLAAFVAAITLGAPALSGAAVEAGDPASESRIRPNDPTLVPDVPPLTSSEGIHLRALAEELDRTGAITLPIGDRQYDLLLAEHDVFGPDGRSVYETDARGNEVLVGVVTARTYQGTVRGQDSSAAFVSIDVAHESLLGEVYADGLRFSLTSAPMGSGWTQLTTTWRLDSVAAPPVHHHGAEEIGALDGSRNAQWRMESDPDYRTYASDWQNRIANAVNRQHNMWYTYVDAHVTIDSYGSFGSNANANCDSAITQYQTDVKNRLVASTTLRHVENFQLFTASPLYVVIGGVTYDCFGVAYNSAMRDLTNYRHVSVIEAKDNEPNDSYYDPDLTHDLAMDAGHEMGHQWGEADHPTDSACWEYKLGVCTWTVWNIMDTVQPFRDQGAWFTTGSQSDIQTYAWTRI